MEAQDFLNEWINDVTNEFNENANHEYTEQDVIDILNKHNEYRDNNNFVHIVEDRTGVKLAYLKTREDAKKEIKRIQRNHREALVINCQKIYTL